MNEHQDYIICTYWIERINTANMLTCWNDNICYLYIYIDNFNLSTPAHICWVQKARPAMDRNTAIGTKYATKNTHRLVSWITGNIAMYILFLFMYVQWYFEWCRYSYMGWFQIQGEFGGMKIEILKLVIIIIMVMVWVQRGISYIYILYYSGKVTSISWTMSWWKSVVNHNVTPSPIPNSV